MFLNIYFLILSFNIFKYLNLKEVPLRTLPTNSEDIKERQLLTQLSNRLAHVINGATGEKL